MESFSIVIWVDPNIDNPENSRYVKDLQNYKYINVKCFKQVKSAIYEIKKIQFEETIIILSGKLYFDFIEQFKENIKEINIIPKFIIFSSKLDKLPNDKKENSFYISGGFKDNFSDIKKYILKCFNEISSNIDNEGHLTIELIDKAENLLLPILYKSLIDKPQYDEINIFNEKMYSHYSKESKNFKKLLNSILSTREIPIELLTKYYARMYRADFYNDDNNFHSNMNKDLRENKYNLNNIYLPYIKTLYEGIKLKSFPLASNQTLYRGSFLLTSEIEKIKNYLGNRNQNLFGLFAFSREFLSFYKEKKIVENYFKNTNNYNVYFSKVLFILEKNNNIDYNLSTHIDIENISFQNEKEVLFLPFSSFEIKEIKDNNSNNIKGYEIKLSYLDKYLKVNDNSKINIENIIPETEFKKQIIQSGLIKPEQINNYKNLILKYKQYKNQINNKNQISNNQINNNQINNNDTQIINMHINKINEINYNKNNISQIGAKTQIVKKNKNNKSKLLNNINYIIGILNITEDDINKKIQVINSYEELKRNGNFDVK